MSGLTDGERDRLADLEQQLALEAPRLAAGLRRLNEGHSSWFRSSWFRPAGWLMTVVGALLLFSGEVLRDASTTLSGVVLLSCCWVPFMVARHTGAQPAS